MGLAHMYILGFRVQGLGIYVHTYTYGGPKIWGSIYQGQSKKDFSILGSKLSSSCLWHYVYIYIVVYA